MLRYLAEEVQCLFYPLEGHLHEDLVVQVVRLLEEEEVECPKGQFELKRRAEDFYFLISGITRPSPLRLGFVLE